MLWNCVEVSVLLVGGVEKVCPWGGVEMQDATPLHGDCFPDSVTGVWKTKGLKGIGKRKSTTFHSSQCVFFCWLPKRLNYTMTLLLHTDGDGWLPAVQRRWGKPLSFSRLAWFLQRWDNLKSRLELWGFRNTLYVTANMLLLTWGRSFEESSRSRNSRHWSPLVRLTLRSISLVGSGVDWVGGGENEVMTSSSDFHLSQPTYEREKIKK